MRARPGWLTGASWAGRDGAKRDRAAVERKRVEAQQKAKTSGPGARRGPELQGRGDPHLPEKIQRQRLPHVKGGAT